MQADTSDHTPQDQPTSETADAGGEFAGDALGKSVPARIGSFRLSRVIATGGMGTVYLAEQDHPRRVVALKLMQPTLASPDAARRFARESELLGRMRHPNIAQVYEAGIHRHAGAEIPYYAMEYIAGAKPITAFVSRNDLSITHRLELFADVCDAVHHGHQRGVIHRDLKPGNILVDADGRPKVIDFGVARTTDADLAVTLQTRTGQVIGTMAYMSPEQVMGDPHMIDARTDVYALGVILYELLCGRLPYDLGHAQVHEAMQIIREREPDRPSAITSTVRGDLQTIILTALEKDRSRRYQSADELRQDILRWLRGDPIVARPPSITYLLASRFRRFTRRHPAVALLVVAAIVGVLGSAGGWALLYGPLGGPLHQRYIDLLGAVMPPPASFADMEHVRIIRLTDHTFERVPELAERLEMPEVTLTDLRSLRRLNGRLMERLADAGARTVVWDFRMAGATPHDAGFLRGVDALRDADAGAVVVIREWKGDPELTEDHISPAALAHPHVRRGAPKARFMNVGCEIDVLAIQGNYEVPSLILAGYLSYHHPAGRVRYSLEKKGRRAIATCYVHDDPDRPHIERVTNRLRIPLSGIVTYKQPIDGLAPGDVTGAIVVNLPDEEVIERESIEYSHVFDMEPSELRRAFDGKAVVVADYRDGIDRHEYLGRLVSGGDVIATGLEALFHGPRWIIRWERPEVSVLAVLAASLLGVTVAGVSGGRWVRTILFAAFVAALVIASCLLAFSLVRYILNPLVPAVVLLLAAVIGAAVLQLRQTSPT